MSLPDIFGDEWTQRAQTLAHTLNKNRGDTWTHDSFEALQNSEGISSGRTLSLSTPEDLRAGQAEIPHITSKQIEDQSLFTRLSGQLNMPKDNWSADNYSKFLYKGERGLQKQIYANNNLSVSQKDKLATGVISKMEGDFGPGFRAGKTTMQDVQSYMNSVEKIVGNYGKQSPSGFSDFSKQADEADRVDQRAERKARVEAQSAQRKQSNTSGFNKFAEQARLNDTLDEITSAPASAGISSGYEEPVTHTETKAEVEQQSKVGGEVKSGYEELGEKLLQQKKQQNIANQLNGSFAQNQAAIHSSKFAEASASWDGRKTKRQAAADKKAAEAAGRAQEARLKSAEGNYGQLLGQIKTDQANQIGNVTSTGKAKEKEVAAINEAARNTRTQASLVAAREAGANDSDIFTGGNKKSVTNKLGKRLRGEAGVQFSQDMKNARNAMTALQDEKARVQKKYGNVMGAVEDKTKWGSMSNTEKLKAMGKSDREIERISNHYRGHFGKLRSAFGRVADSVGAIKSVATGKDGGLKLSGLRNRVSDAYNERQSARSTRRLNSSKKATEAVDTAGKRMAARGQRLNDMTDKTIDDLKRGDYKSAKIINDIADGKSANRVIQKANPMKRSAAEKAPVGGKKGLGLKGKAGAVMGLLALGGVLGNMMGNHGEQSNAQMYNPNPQPQYYS